MLANKKKLLILAVAIVVVLAGMSILLMAFPGGETQPEPTSTPQPSPTKAVVKSSVKSPDPAVYTELVKQYEGYRIQFDAGCQAIPKNVTYKNGTKILLDNRSGDARYISVGGISHYLAGYGYKIITLSSAKLPKNLLISCGSAVNVGQILIQN